MYKISFNNTHNSLEHSYISGQVWFTGSKAKPDVFEKWFDIYFVSKGWEQLGTT